jgi:hypothetical protein
VPNRRARHLLHMASAGILAIIASASISTVALAQQPKLAWTVANLKTLNATFTGAQSVDLFLQGLSEDDFAVDPNAQEWAFVDLAGNGHLELLITIDPGGRDFVNALVCVWQSGATMKWQTIGGFDLENLPSRIVQLLPNGQHQVLVDDLLEQYQGAKAVPSIKHVYAWGGKGLVLSDTKYKQYYRTNVLPELQEELKSLVSSPDGCDPDQVARYKKEIAAVRAILGGQ